MRARTASLLACAVAAIATASADARSQAPGSFAGQWVLTSISPQRPAYDQFWFGTEPAASRPFLRTLTSEWEDSFRPWCRSTAAHATAASSRRAQAS
jgi:hypothetical protein